MPTMTLREAIYADPFIGIYLALAIGCAGYVFARVLLFFCEMGTSRFLAWFKVWNINRICAREHRKMLRAIERRRREAKGDTLLDELGAQFDGKPMPAAHDRSFSLTRNW